MQPELESCREDSGASIDRLAERLYDLAGDQDVRVIEALAAVLANRFRDGSRLPSYGLSEPIRSSFSCAPDDADAAARLAICRRVARRAVRGSLIDPTGGATAWHRIEVSPAWSRDLLPIGMFGPFLFYRLTPAEPRARAWFDGGGDEQPEHAGSERTASAIRPTLFPLTWASADTQD